MLPLNKLDFKFCFVLFVRCCKCAIVSCTVFSSRPLSVLRNCGLFFAIIFIFVVIRKKVRFTLVMCSHFSPEFLKWTLPSSNFKASIVAHRDLSQETET